MTGILDGRIALVTGCTGGIGSEISRALSAAGATVVGADMPDDASAWAASLTGPADYHKLDVTVEADWQRVIGAVEKKHQALDILVHNAGIVVVARMEDLSLADWQRMMAVNVDGPFLGTRVAAQLMRRTGEQRPFGTSIINISSVAGLIGSPLHTGYCASKGALRLFTKAAAMEFSALGYKIRVNSIHPSGVRTKMVDHIMERFVEHGFAKSVEDAFAATMVAHPMGRMAEPVDIAKAVRFLASDESGYMHGSELIVDGGYVAQ